MDTELKEILEEFIKNDIDSRMSEDKISKSDIERKLTLFLEENSLNEDLTQEEYEECVHFVESSYKDYMEEEIERTEEDIEKLKLAKEEADRKARELLEKGFSTNEEDKVAEINVQEATSAANKKWTVSDSSNLLGISKALKDSSYLVPALQVLDYAFQVKLCLEKRFNDKDLSDEELESLDNKIQSCVEILAGNQGNIEVLLNAYVLSNLIAYVSNKDKSNAVYKLISNSNLENVKVLRQTLNSQKLIKTAKEIFAGTLSSCFKNEISDYSSPVSAIKGLELLKSFDVHNRLVGAKLNRRTMPYDIKLSDEEQEEIDKEIEKLNESIITSAGGMEAYIKKAQSLLRAYESIEITKITGTDDMVLSETLDIEEEIKGRISDIKDCIMSVYKTVFETPIMLGQIKGAVLFSDKGTNQRGVDVLSIIPNSSNEKGDVSLEIENIRESKTLSWIVEDYEYPVKQQEGIKVARHNEVPSMENIFLKGYNYYPRFVLRYALGFVGKEKYTNFDKFLKALDSDVEQRLYRIYKDSCVVNGETVLGEELFYTSKEYRKYRKSLIGSFINSVLLLSGSKSPDMFNNVQFRSTSVYKHTGTVDSYLNNGEYGLLNCASKKYMEVGEEEFENCILDVMVIKDLEVFNSQVTWAYKVLGKVYSSGDIPPVDGSDGVIIGQQADGKLIKFTLGGNSSFVTSIYAGSRSGKGVTTLSILGATLASNIGMMYLDFKPDMSECFLQYERENSRVHTYAVDMQPNSIRCGYTAKDSLRKQNKSFAKQSSLASAFLILKNLQVMTLYATYLKEKGKGLTHLWVLDEINNMVMALDSGYEFLTDFIKKHEPKKGEEASEDYNYAVSIQSFWEKLTKEINEGRTATFGVSGTKFLVIGQDPLQVIGNTNKSSGSYIISTLAGMATNRYIVGRGLSNTRAVGSILFHRTASKQEKSLLEDCRYFIMRNTTSATVSEACTDVLFKPLLTLNSSNILDRCWITGLGKSYGYSDKLTKGSQEYNDMLYKYKKTLNESFHEYVGIASDDKLSNNDVGEGIVDDGTGFPGLLRLYFSSLGDYAAQQSAAELAVSRGYSNIFSSFTEMGLIGENSPFGYEYVEDFIFDFSEKAISFVKYDEYLDFVSSLENESSGESSEKDKPESKEMSNLLNTGGTPFDRDNKLGEVSDDLESDMNKSENSAINKGLDKSLESSNEEFTVLDEYKSYLSYYTNSLSTLQLAYESLNTNSNIDDVEKCYDSLVVVLREITNLLSSINALKEKNNNLSLKGAIARYINSFNKLLSDGNSLLGKINKLHDSIVNKEIVGENESVEEAEEIVESPVSELFENTSNMIESYNESEVVDTKEISSLLNKYEFAIRKINKKLSLEDISEEDLYKIKSELDLVQEGLFKVKELISALLSSSSPNAQNLFSQYQESCDELFNDLYYNTDLLEKLLENKSLQRDAEIQRTKEDFVNGVSSEDVYRSDVEQDLNDTDNTENQKSNSNLDYYVSLLQTYVEKADKIYYKIESTKKDIKYIDVFKSALDISNKIMNNVDKVLNIINAMNLSEFDLSKVSGLLENVKIKVDMINSFVDSVLSQIDVNENLGDSDSASPSTEKVLASPQVKLKKSSANSITRVVDGVAFVDEIRYFDVMNEALEGLDDDYRRHSRIGFIDRALVAKNLKDRYKIVVNSIKQTIGWENVDTLTMTSSEFKVNDEQSINVVEYGSNGYSLYSTMDFGDLLLNRAIRLRQLILDEEIFNQIVEDCGGDIFEILFNKRPTLQTIVAGDTKMTRNKRNKSVQLAFEEKAKTAAKKGNAKDELVEELFASGKVKKTPENIALARKMTQKASKNGRKLNSNKGLITAQRFAQMTPVQAITGFFASGFLYVGGLLRKARTN